MRLTELAGAVRRWHLALRGTPRLPRAGGTEPAEARRLADAERALGQVPDGCAWLDERTVGDLDLPLVFGAIDRTTTPTGAQALWRWLVAPAQRLATLADRERRLASFADPALRQTVQLAIGRTAVTSNAPYLPRLLWEPAPRPLPLAGFIALLVAIAIAAVVALWFPIALLAVVAVFAINVIVDDWANHRLAQQAHALEVLGDVLAAAERTLPHVPTLGAGVADDLAVVRRLRKRISVLALRDPLDILNVLRAGFLVRLFTLGSCMAMVERERERLRRLVLWIGELDAAVSVASLRAERDDARLPELVDGAPRIEARDLVHPVIEDAIGNELSLVSQSLLVTGSNMSGKSTFLRALAVNAICAQSIHTTFGHWRASLFRVFAVMRTTDDTAAGASTYAVEVAAIGQLVAAAAGEGLPALFAIDEPFSGTNPSVRVPIVVSVLDYLSAHDVALAATHDLQGAAQVDPRFGRGHVCELDELLGLFDRKLRPGVAPSSNALALLERAGYPPAIVEAARRGPALNPVTDR